MYGHLMAFYITCFLLYAIILQTERINHLIPQPSGSCDERPPGSHGQHHGRDVGGQGGAHQEEPQEVILPDVQVWDLLRGQEPWRMGPDRTSKVRTKKY